VEYLNLYEPNEIPRHLLMELQDVFTDIETPPTSEDEDPEAPISTPPRTPHIHALLLNMLAAVSTPRRDAFYSELYCDRHYLSNVSKKLKKMKKKAKRVDFEAVYRDEYFWHHLARIERTYPDDGGRSFLNHLVALECHLTTEYETESESETDSEPEETSKKENNPDNKDQDFEGQLIVV